ncbi:MAG: TadE family protein [Dehalococcoidia bacterium]
MFRSSRPRLASNAAVRRPERGQALLEIGVLLPLFLIIVLGIVEVTNALNTHITVINTARDGARMGSKGAATDAQIKNMVVMEADRLRDPIDPVADITVEYLTVDGVDAVAVEVCNEHTLLLNVPLVLPDTLRMCSTTTMRVVGS